MDARLFCIVLLGFLSSERSYVFGLRAEGIEGVGSLVTNVTLKNQRIYTRFPNIDNDEIAYRNGYTECGRVLTEAPGEITKEFNSKYAEYSGNRCTWIVTAPDNQHVYVYYLHYESHLQPTDESTAHEDKKEFTINIYDGILQGKTTKLFRYGDTSINSVLSRGNSVTIDLGFGDPEKYATQTVTLRYGFLKKGVLSGQTEQ